MSFKPRERTKVAFTFIVFVVLLTGILGRAFYLQVINKEKLLAYSDSQFLRKATVFPNRGHIYDREGNPLAINVRVYNIFTIPKLLEDREKTLNEVAKAVPNLKLSKLQKAIKGRNRFTWLARKISITDEQVEKLENLKGVFVEETTKRVYPNHELLSQTLGFVGIDNVGLAGLEYAFDEKLKGKERVIRYMKDAKGRPIKFESYHKDHRAEDLNLTIQKDVQAFSERALRKAVLEHKGSKGGVGVIDALTGEIVAMANYPTFDPNRKTKETLNYQRLSFASDPFEPGSVMKIFTVASALENKIVTPDTNYFCEKGRLKVGNHYITESSPYKKYEWLSVKDIIVHSSNIGTTKIAFDLTFPLLDQTLKKFGFAEKTGIELPVESRGIYPHQDSVTPLSLSNLSFGQGVAVTGVQMLAAYAAIANGGHYYKPTIIKSSKRPEGRRVISSDLAGRLNEMLIETVEEGTAKAARVPYFQIAGKTGTAQKADKNGVYSSYIANFVGYPVNTNKKFVVFAYIEDPSDRWYQGGKVAAPLVKKIIEYMLFKNREHQNLEISKVSNRPNIDKISLKQSSKRHFGKGKMPSFIGLDKKTAKRLAATYKLKVDERGMGVVSGQIPEAGSDLNNSESIILTFKPPKYE